MKNSHFNRYLDHKDPNKTKLSDLFIERLFARTSIQSKIIQISPNVILDFSDLGVLKKICATLDALALSGEVQAQEVLGHYEELIRECSVYPDAMAEQNREKEYVAYINKEGFFFKGRIINFFTEIFKIIASHPKFDAILKLFIDNGILKTELSLDKILGEFSVEKQLELVDPKAIDTIVVGCARGLEDRSLIDHAHACLQPHDKKSLIVDLAGYGHNADVIGFDGMSLVHWRVLSKWLQKHKIIQVVDHTSCMFDSKLCHSGGSTEAEPHILHQIASYIRENILTPGGTILQFATSNGACNVPISDEYYHCAPHTTAACSGDIESTAIIENYSSVACRAMGVHEDQSSD